MSLHPSVAAVRRGVRRTLEALPDGAVVVVACSGGADSLALAAAAVHEARARSLRVVGVTVDHGLQDGSSVQAARVVEQLAALGVDETVTARVSVEAAGVGPEAAAREARYAVLGQVADSLGAGVVLLGHTLDDQAETVLMGLARGSGGRSLAGMRRSFGVFARPLLDVRRDDTLAACRVEGIVPWADPHNADRRFTRPRVRHDVLPLLEDALGPGVARTLARTAEQVRADVDHLDDLADEACATLPDPPGVEALLALPGVVRRRVLRLLALEAGAPASELFHEHVLSIEALLVEWHGQKWVDLPGHLRARRRDGVLVLVRA